MRTTTHVSELSEEEHALRLAKRKDWYYSRSEEYKQKLLRKQREYTAKRKIEAQERGEKIHRAYKTTLEQRERHAMQNVISKEKRIQEHEQELKDKGLTGYRVCTRCTRAKPLADFIGANGRDLCVLCNTCRAGIYKSTRPQHGALTADFWGRKAISVNRLVLKTVRKSKPEATLFDLEETLTGADLAALCDKQHGKCYYCDVDLDEGLHVDHKTPLSKGGGNTVANVCLACPDCNRMKWTKTEQEFKDALMAFVERMRCKVADKEPQAQHNR